MIQKRKKISWAIWNSFYQFVPFIILLNCHIRVFLSFLFIFFLFNFMWFVYFMCFSAALMVVIFYWTFFISTNEGYNSFLCQVTGQVITGEIRLRIIFTKVANHFYKGSSLRLGSLRLGYDRNVTYLTLNFT